MSRDSYDIGQAIGLLHESRRFAKQAGDAEISYAMTGKLYLSQSGWLLLQVPNHIGRGTFDALTEPGIELPMNERTGHYNAHVSVMRPEEIASIPGGAGAITERGHHVSYTLGPLRTVRPSGWDEYERVWFIEVRSPDLEKLRKSYGLTAKPNKDKFDFHITVAVRKRHVLRGNDTSKAASIIHYPELRFSAGAAKWPEAATQGTRTKTAANLYKVSKSPIHGHGVFCTRGLDPGDEVGAALIKEADGSYRRSELGKNINHAERPNCVLVGGDDDRYVVVADSEIAANSELTCNYHEAYSLLGDDAKFENGAGKDDFLKEAAAPLSTRHPEGVDGSGSPGQATAGGGPNTNTAKTVRTGEKFATLGDRLWNPECASLSTGTRNLPPSCSNSEKNSADQGRLAKLQARRTEYDPLCPHCGEVMYERHYVPDSEGDGYRHRGPCYDKGAFAIHWPRDESVEVAHADWLSHAGDREQQPGAGGLDGPPAEKQAATVRSRPLWLGFLTAEDAGDVGRDQEGSRAAIPGGRGEKRADLLPGVQLQPHQARVADPGQHDAIRKLLFHSLGSGKTLASIAAAEQSGGPYLATVPAALRPNFRKEQARFTDQETPSDIHSYNSLAKAVPPDEYDTAIFDESHRLRNEDAKQTQNAKIVAKRAKNLLLLSGSPVINHPRDFAPQMEMLTGNPMPAATFDSQYVGEKTVRPSWLARFRGVKPAKVPTLKNTDQLKRQLEGHVDYHAPATPEVEQIDERYPVSMSSEQERLYQAFWDQLPWTLRWKLQNEFPLSKQEIGNLSSFLAGPRQVGLSTLPFMRGRRNPLKAFEQSPKLQRAMELSQESLKDPNAKVVAFSNFLEAGLEPYAAALAAKKVPYGMFHGGLNDADRKRVVEDYNSGKTRQLLLAPAGAEGISLKGTTALQLLDPHWNESRLDQAVGRGIRFDSHTHLPPDQRKVRVQRFVSELPPGLRAKLWRWFIQTKPSNKMNNPGTDTYLENMARKKQELNDQFLELLKEVGTEKQGQSFYLDALAQTPVNIDLSRGVLSGVGGHLANVKARGDRAITEAESWDSLQNAMDPDRAIRQTQSYLAGRRQPLVSHPVDVILRG